MEYKKFAAVIVDLYIKKPLDYGIPDSLIPQIKRGVRVQVPVKGFPRTGYVFEVKDEPSFTPVLPISSVTSTEPVVSEELFELAIWMSDYYCAPLRQVFKVMLPPSIRKSMKPKEQQFVTRAKTREALIEKAKEVRLKNPLQASVLDVMLRVKKGILLTELLEKANASRACVNALCKKGDVALEKIRVDRSPLANAEYFKQKPKKLNAEQAQALDNICNNLKNNSFSCHLLYGVTGSGKTEVYLQAIDQALKMGKGAIMLVPEISLTAQTIERFRSRFDNAIAILHHRLSLGERLDEWERVRQGKAKIVIGARSAVFSPVVNLGLIIVDEEHESSYKQSEEAPCYHARDVAVMRSKLGGCSVVLGSATPSIESYYNTHVGKYILSELNERADHAKIPRVTIVDMKQEFERNKGYTNFSELLLNGISKRLETGEQTILFLNRRGYHTTLKCPDCNEVMQCPHCDVSLTFHLNDKTLACHLCDYRLSPPPLHCPHCKACEPMKFRGVGTEQIERALHAIFPEVRTLRLDADTTKHKGTHEKLLRQFATGKADVLIGTQMIAKGLHFSQVTLVGVLNADANLHIPDYRASETGFQLITQVAGRSGRGALEGEVIIQSSMPDNRTIELASLQDYPSFYEEEIAAREAFHFPPFTKMIKLTFSGKDERGTMQVANHLQKLLEKTLSPRFAVHPVIPAGHAKVKDLFRFQCLIRGQAIYPVNQVLKEVQEQIPSRVKLLVDVNPTSTFY